MKEYRFSYHYFAQKFLSLYKISPHGRIACALGPGCTVASPALWEAFAQYVPFFLVLETLFDVGPSVHLPPVLCSMAWRQLQGSVYFPRGCCLCPSSSCGTILKLFRTFSAHLSGVLIQYPWTWLCPRFPNSVRTAT